MLKTVCCVHRWIYGLVVDGMFSRLHIYTTKVNNENSPKTGCLSISCSWGGCPSNGFGIVPGGYGKRAKWGPAAKGSTRGWTGPAEPARGKKIQGGKIDETY